MGLATAKEFIKEGATVIITGRNPGKINETVKQLGAKAFGFVSDAGEIADIFALPEQVKKHTGKIDILYVNAGYGKFAPIELVDETNFDELFNVLVKGAFFTVQQLLPIINESGSIILNTSIVTDARKVMVLAISEAVPKRLKGRVGVVASITPSTCSGDMPVLLKIFVVI